MSTTLPALQRVDELPEQLRSLVREAAEARARALAPYSGFRVGAAVLDASGASQAGCNVESPVYGLTLCAERVALFAARAAGHDRPRALAVVASTSRGEPTTPCGACRQVILDLCGDIVVLTATCDGLVRQWSAAALLPAAFAEDDLPGMGA